MACTAAALQVLLPPGSGAPGVSRKPDHRVAKAGVPCPPAVVEEADR